MHEFCQSDPQFCCATCLDCQTPYVSTCMWHRVASNHSHAVNTEFHYKWSLGTFLKNVAPIKNNENISSDVGSVPDVKMLD